MCKEIAPAWRRLLLLSSRGAGKGDVAIPWRTKMSRGAAQRDGFTLIELLVVLAVIGICVVLVVAHAAPDERATVQLEAERLAQVLDLAANEARLTGTAIAWTADADGYRFRRYSEERGWSEVRGSDVLRPRVLPDGVAVAGVRVENGGPQTRQIVIGAFAPAPIFSITLAAASTSSRVVGSPIGEIRVEGADAH